MAPSCLRCKMAKADSTPEEFLDWINNLSFNRLDRTTRTLVEDVERTAA